MRASDVIEQIQRLCEDPHGDVHDTDSVLKSLNRALSDISVRSRSIADISYERIYSDQFRYGLSDGFLEIHLAGYIYGNNPDNWYPLTRTTLAATEFLSNSAISFQRPYSYDIWGRASLETMNSTVEESLPNNEFRPAGNISENVRTGQRIINVTDRSEGFIDALPGTNIIRYRDLRGGADNEMQVNDVFQTLTAHAPLHTIVLSPKPRIADTQGQESLWIYQSRKHRTITTEHIAHENDYLELDAELESALLHLSCYWQRIPELGINDSVIATHKSEYETEYRKYAPFFRDRVRENMNAWKVHAQNAHTAYLRGYDSDGGLADGRLLFNAHNIFRR